jgi:hypothetical protein
MIFMIKKVRPETSIEAPFEHFHSKISLPRALGKVCFSYL